MSEPYPDERVSRAAKYEHHGLRLSETGSCPRARHFFASDAVIDEEASLPWGLIEFGNAWEDMWMSKLMAVDDGWEQQKEVELYGVLGHLDGWHAERGQLLEVKTVSINARKFLPNDGHIMQLAAYSAALKEHPLEGTPKEIVLLYFFREDPEQSQRFVWDCASGEWGMFEDRARRATNTAIETLEFEIAPKIPDANGPSKYPCVWRTKNYENRCPFFSHCWNEPEPKPVAETPGELTVEFMSALIACWRDWRADKSLTDVKFKAYKVMLDAASAMLSDKEDSQFKLPHNLTLQRRVSQRIDTKKARLLFSELPMMESESWTIKEGADFETE